MSNPSTEPDGGHDQDAEPTLNAPEEGRPDGMVADDDDGGDGDEA